MIRRTSAFAGRLFAGIDVSQDDERVGALLGRGFPRALDGGRQLFPDLRGDRYDLQSVIRTLWKAAQLLEYSYRPGRLGGVWRRRFACRASNNHQDCGHACDPSRTLKMRRLRETHNFRILSHFLRPGFKLLFCFPAAEPLADPIAGPPLTIHSPPPPPPPPPPPKKISARRTP